MSHVAEKPMKIGWFSSTDTSSLEKKIEKQMNFPPFMFLSQNQYMQVLTHFVWKYHISLSVCPYFLFHSSFFSLFLWYPFSLLSSCTVSILLSSCTLPSSSFYLSCHSLISKVSLATSLLPTLKHISIYLFYHLSYLSPPPFSLPPFPSQTSQLIY